MPGLAVINGQLDLDRVVIWGGYGMELDRYPAPGKLGRVALGMGYRVE